jgi:hypothetical protein
MISLLFVALNCSPRQKFVYRYYTSEINKRLGTDREELPCCGSNLNLAE